MREYIEGTIDEAGRLTIPAELRTQYGLVSGAKVYMARGVNELHLRRPITHLARIYIEPTNRCNLQCVTCIRNTWNEPLGEMKPEIFHRILEGMRLLEETPDVVFGGMGEPLFHPDIVEMVREVKKLGSSVELITNGMLLSKTMSRQLIDAGLDKLWVSLDGATPESYQDVRLGAALPEVLANLAEFRHARWTKHYPVALDQHLQPHLGIVFVAMKRNIHDLPAVFRLAARSGALNFMVTNVIPYTFEMQEEILYSRALTDAAYTSSPWLGVLDIPKIDINPITREPIYQAMRAGYSLVLAGASLGGRENRCPFLEKGSLSIRWDGAVSPCLALLHNHKVYLYKYERLLKSYQVGNVLEQPIGDIWNKPEYLSFRARLQKFDFSPCTLCGGCDYFESNQEDCIGSPFPACGGCLWAQGIVQCP